MACDIDMIYIDLLNSIFIGNVNAYIIACLGNGCFLLRLNPSAQKIVGKSPVHCSRVYIDKPLLLCKELCYRAFSGACRSVNRYLIPHESKPPIFVFILRISPDYSVNAQEPAAFPVDQAI